MSEDRLAEEAAAHLKQLERRLERLAEYARKARRTRTEEDAEVFMRAIEIATHGHAEGAVNGLRAALTAAGAEPLGGWPGIRVTPSPFLLSTRQARAAYDALDEQRLRAAEGDGAPLDAAQAELLGHLAGIIGTARPARGTSRARQRRHAELQASDDWRAEARAFLEAVLGHALGDEALTTLALEDVAVDPEQNAETRARADALLYGTGYLVDGQRVAPQVVRVFTRTVTAPQDARRVDEGTDAYVDLVFTHPPGPGLAALVEEAFRGASDLDEAKRRVLNLPVCDFIEAEDARGRGVSVGQWLKRRDGCWALRIGSLTLQRVLDGAELG